MFENLDKQRALVLGVVSGIAVAGGIIMSVLMHMTVLTFTRRESSDLDTQINDSLKYASGSIWVFGLVYIIPGVVGVIAAFVQNKCMYVITSIFTILSVIIMGIVCLFAGLALIGLVFGVGSVTEHCVDSSSGCRCSMKGGRDYQVMPFSNCDELKKFTSLAVALMLFIVLSWVAVLTEFIAAVYFSCKMTSSSGGVVLSSPQPLLPRGEMAPQGYGPNDPLPAKV